MKLEKKKKLIPYLLCVHYSVIVVILRFLRIPEQKNNERIVFKKAKRTGPRTLTRGTPLPIGN